MASNGLRGLLHWSLPRCYGRHCIGTKHVWPSEEHSGCLGLPGVGTSSMQQTRQYSFFQLDKVFSFKRLKEERLRLQDEMDRGYFEDFKDLKKNQGKLAPASKGLLPVAGSASFPELVCRVEDGTQIAIQDVLRKRAVTLACVAFRQNAQPMVDSWTAAFAQDFRDQPATQLVELSVVESIFLRPVQSYLVKSMSSLRRHKHPVAAPPDKSKPHTPTIDAETPPNRKSRSELPSLDSASPPSKQQHILLYHFAETWAMRRALNMPNRLTAYALLIDSEGQVRWQATGFATKDEITSLQRATQLLVSETGRSAVLANDGNGVSRSSRLTAPTVYRKAVIEEKESQNDEDRARAKGLQGK